MAPRPQAFMGVGGVRHPRRTSSGDQCPHLGPGSLAFPGNEGKDHSPGTSAPAGNPPPFPPPDPEAQRRVRVRRHGRRTFACVIVSSSNDSHHLRTVKGRSFARSDPEFANILRRDLAQRHARVSVEGKVGSSATASGRERHRRWVEAPNMSAKTESRRSSGHWACHCRLLQEGGSRS
jgi:hypothetical protein